MENHFYLQLYLYMVIGVLAFHCALIKFIVCELVCESGEKRKFLSKIVKFGSRQNSAEIDLI